MKVISKLLLLLFIGLQPIAHATTVTTSNDVQLAIKLSNLALADLQKRDMKALANRFSFIKSESDFIKFISVINIMEAKAGKLISYEEFQYKKSIHASSPINIRHGYSIHYNARTENYKKINLRVQVLINEGKGEIIGIYYDFPLS